MALTQQQNLPQQYVTDLSADYGKQLAGLTSIPLDTARLAPQVAAQDPLQTQAYNLAGSGVGAYQPYLTQQAAMSGNLGGGREGVMRSEYMSNQDANRALIQSKLLQQGFNQANLNAQTAFNQQGTLGGNIQNFQTADINQLGR